MYHCEMCVLVHVSLLNVCSGLCIIVKCVFWFMYHCEMCVLVQTPDIYKRHPFKCKRCGHFFYNKEKLKDHRCANRRFRCEKCGKHFASNSALIVSNAHNHMVARAAIDTHDSYSMPTSEYLLIL